MDKTSLVPRLEDLAFAVSFKEILNNLVLCRDLRSNENQLQIVQFSSLLSLFQPFLTSENLISIMRNCLEHHLNGKFSNDKMRKKYVETFYKAVLNSEGNIIEPWAFLDCVLDNTCQELVTHTAFPGAEPNSLLISTIAKRSPQLQKLKIDSSLMQSTTRVEQITPLISSLSSLQHLTSLDFHQMQESHRSVLKLIGKVCPVLTHLSISGFDVSANDIFSLILGEFVDQLFPDIGDPKVWAEDFSSLEFLQAPSEILTACCFSLRHLQLISSGWYRMYKINKNNKLCSLATFILRHLPFLEKMNGNGTSFGVEKLRNSTSSPNEAKKRKLNDLVIAQQFEDTCKELATLRSGTVQNAVFVNRSTFSGSLSLVSLDLVYLCSNMLQTIGKFCPHLKEVRFCLESRIDVTGEDISPPNEVEKHLEEWPKLENITLEDVSSEYAIVILEAFASSLKSVIYESCNDINLMDLLSCTQLESFSIWGADSSLEESKIDPGQLSPDSFLPKLESCKSDICLGVWSLWLEGKSKLTHVVLDCWHTGTSARSQPDSSRIPKMWPNLEKLDLRRCAGLTMSTVAEMIPQLYKLKEVFLPEIVAKTDPKMAATLWEDLKYRPSPVHLYFNYVYPVTRCSLLPASTRKSPFWEPSDLYPSDEYSTDSS